MVFIFKTHKIPTALWSITQEWSQGNKFICHHTKMHSTCTQTHTHKLKTSHQRQCCEAASEGDVMKLLCIHQNHVILNHWSGLYFTPLFRRGKGKSKNSLWASVPRSLSMFSQSGSISEFRWASCSSHRFCVSCTVTHIGAAVHMHTQPYMHNTHFALKHTCCHTHTHTHTNNSLPPEFQYCTSEWESSASNPHSTLPLNL